MKALLTATIFHLNGFSYENRENSKWLPGVQIQCHSFHENSFKFYINKRNSNGIFFASIIFKKFHAVFKLDFELFIANLIKFMVYKMNQKK